jgi:light-regulated signal transduction histidine kinase (bacteriophytochrome)
VVSHDLQEPLRSVSSYVQLLSRRYRDRLDADAVDFIDFAVGGARRMQQLIADMLTFSRVGTRGRRSYRPACRPSTKARSPACRRRSTSRTPPSRPIRCPRSSPTPASWRSSHESAGNALKFRGDQPPHVHVGATRTGRMWTITVQDNGIGIAPEYFERIFVIFQRLHAREEYAGTGVGLAICKKIVERHGGRIWVDSTPARGARFSFTLPAVAE